MSFNQLDKTTLEVAVISSNTGADAIKRAPIVEEDTGFRCLRIGDVSNNKPYSEWGFTNADDKVREKFALKKEDIVIARTGNTIGVVRYIDKDVNSVYNNGLIRLKIDKSKFDSKYVYYNLKSNAFKHFVFGISGGTSTQPNMKINHTLKFEITNFKLQEQKSIAKVLSDLDKKIEVNNQINDNLEKMAQAIFKQWFVDFEFPNENGEPYKSSGGEMVESELGSIPKGWQIKSVYELAEYINGTSFKKYEINENDGLPIIKIAELKNGISDSTKYCSVEKDKKYYLESGDILFSWSGNPNTSIDVFIWDKGSAILNQHIFKVKAAQYTNELMFVILKYLKPNFMSIASNKQTTGLGHVTVNDLKRMRIVLPSDYLVLKLSKKIKLLIQETHIRNMQNYKLTNLRDVLLPKLMSGEIRVTTVE